MGGGGGGKSRLACSCHCLIWTQSHSTFFFYMDSLTNDGCYLQLSKTPPPPPCGALPVRT